MSYDEVLELPLKVFSLYNTNINRLRAEEDLRTIQIMALSQTPSVKDISDRLVEEMGTTFETEKVLDNGYVEPEENAFEKLQGLASIR